MKKFVFMILCVSAFFVGLGSIIQKLSIIFKSDERAAIIVKKLPPAADGQIKLQTVENVSANSRIVKVFSIKPAEKPNTGQFRIHLSAPDNPRQIDEVRVEPADKLNEPMTNDLTAPETVDFKGISDSDDNQCFSQTTGNPTDFKYQINLSDGCDANDPLLPFSRIQTVTVNKDK